MLSYESGFLVQQPASPFGETTPCRHGMGLGEGERSSDVTMFLLSLEKGNDILNLPVFMRARGFMPGSDTKAPPPKIPRIFDRNPELKKRVEEYLAKIPRAKKEEDMRKFEKFVAGEMTWAEIKGYPKMLLKELARMAYLKFKIGDYNLAESLFKGLSIIDHANWYYRAVLGAVYQKQKLYEQAIEEYTMALSLNEKEVTSLTNRGECHLHLKNTIQARKDFEAAVMLDPEEKNSWGKRARVLLKKLIDEGHGEGLGDEGV